MDKILLLFISAQLTYCQINPLDVEIVRDKFGVPHIFGKTDADVAYGLAWANAEDDFETIQSVYLAGSSMLSKRIGNKGIGADFLSQFIGSSELFDSLYEKKISLEYKKIVEAYAEGLNSYAKKYPEEILISELFPITPKKMMLYAQLQLFISSRGDYWIKKILNDDIRYEVNFSNDRGSNAFAFNSSKTKDGKTYLAINTHQPLEGPVSWYEAHLCSEEGTNVIGALFPGSPNILIGANKYLGWAHTVNYPDKTDIFKLEMEDKKKGYYKFDNEVLKLNICKAKLNYKLLGLFNLKINKKFYKSVYGPTLKNKKGYYSIRTPSLFNIGALEQWWNMSKSENFTEFYNVLKSKQIPGYNIVYADKNDTIFYISNGLIPKRIKGFDWKEAVPGNSSKTLWKETYDIDELPQVIQPSSGYVYNANHSPFLSSDEQNNPDISEFSDEMNFETYDNNRSKRIKSLIDSFDKISFDDFKAIKYDNQYPKPYHFSWMDINHLDKLKSKSFPDIAILIENLQNWDRKANISSIGAGTFLMLYHRLYKYYNNIPEPKIISPAVLIRALRDTKNYMMKHFGKLNIQLGEYQKLIRGNKELPSFGLPDVVTAMHSKNYKDGKVKVVAGESYIELVKFSKNGVEIESVISYGNSEKKGSKHFDDQMEMYLNFKTKKMTFDKDKVYNDSEKIYNPK